MATVTTTPRHTPEDLLKMPDGDRYELVDGNLVERDMSFWSSYVGGVLYGLLWLHSREKKLGWVAPEGTSYQCFADAPNRVRRADVSFLRADRLSLQQATEEGHLRIVPDLVTEVISPNDRAYEVEVKVNEWLAAGVRLLWVVNPPVRQVRVHRGDGTVEVVKEGEQLSGEDVVPGFSCRVGELFQPPPGVTPPAV
jgi:Uma2 family endonuclease